MKEAAERARAGEGPSLIEAETYRYYAHTSDDDDRLYRSREEVEEWRRHDPVVTLKQYLIEERLLTQSEEEAVAEEVVTAVAAAVEEAEAGHRPDDPYSHVYARVIEPGPAAVYPEPAVVGPEVNMITAINRAIADVMSAHPNIVVFGEDVAGPKGGVFKATQGISDRFGEDRCFNTPISESLIVGLAIGMGAAATPPPRRDSVCRLHPSRLRSDRLRGIPHLYRSNGDWSCPIVIRVPFGGGIHGALYHTSRSRRTTPTCPGSRCWCRRRPQTSRDFWPRRSLTPTPS